MPIQAQNLPPGKTIYDYPAVFPGQEMTPEQSAQAQVAILAGSVMAASSAKSALTQATVGQIVALLRVADLTSKASIEAFAKSAATLVEAAISHSRRIAWGAVAVRAREMNVSFPATPPTEKQIPKELRFSRSSSLVNAYKRIATEYQENLLRKPDDPIIEQLVEEVEAQSMTPLQRPDMLSNDVVEREIVGEEEWWQAFRESEKEAQAKERAQAKSRVAERRARAKKALEEHQESLTRERSQRDLIRDKRLQEFSESTQGFADRSRKRREDAEAALRAQELADSPEDTAVDEQPVEAPFQLSDAEVVELIERYAQQKAEEAAERAVNHDIQATARNTHALAMKKLPKDKVVGYRRVIHPELSSTGQSCGLCIVASTMRYTRGDLLPIHSMCNCETIEIFMSNGQEIDPGDQINKEDLRVFYEEASKTEGGYTTHGWDLKRSRYSVVEHPEYGPILVGEKKANKTKQAEAVPYAKNGEDNGNN